MVRPYATRSGSRVPTMSKHSEPEPSLSKRKPVKVTDPGLLNRTAWTNAAVALDHIKKVRIMMASVMKITVQELFTLSILLERENTREIMNIRGHEQRGKSTSSR